MIHLEMCFTEMYIALCTHSVDFADLRRCSASRGGGGSNLSMGKRGLLGLILCHLFAGEGVLVCSWEDLSCLYSMTMAHSCIISTNDRINSFCSSRLFTSVWSPTCARPLESSWVHRAFVVHQCT